MLLDALQAETFVLELGTTVQQLRVKNVSPGFLYVFIVKQDHTGGHAIQWGSNIRNASAINPLPFGVTVQCFIADTGGILKSNVPGTWN